MEKSIVNKINNPTESFELYTINTQSSTSKPKKVLRTKPWRNNIKNSFRQRRNALSNTLYGRGDSLIRISHHNHNLKFIRDKSDKHKEIITINVSGNRYETYLSTLENYPNTLLGNKQKRKYYWNNEKQEYFFDRHRACFEAILYYYQSNGRLRRPNYVPVDTFIEEILFFDLGQEAISQITKLENLSIIKYIDLPNCLWRRYIWYYLEYPQNSIIAKIIYLISMFFTVLSCMALAIETLPQYDKKYNINSCHKQNLTSSSLNNTSICVTLISSPFFLIQTICVSYFTMEFLLRLISTPSYYRFLLSILNWIDLSAIVPYFVFLGFELSGKESELNHNTLIIFRIFRLLRFLRIFKIYLIFKQFKSLHVLSSTLKESFVEFLMMITVLTLMAFLFGAALYFAENDTNGQVFDSIPKATYWGIVTITTLGYGDMYPVTTAGRVIACVGALVGLATSGMLISVLVEHYQRVYNRKRFSPEQTIEAIDSSDSEHDEKQDFINRQLSGTRKTLSGRTVIPSTPVSPIVSLINHRKYSQYNSSSSYVRFIITITEDQINNNLMPNKVNQVMKQLTQIIKNTEEPMNLKLISVDKDSSNDQNATTTNELPIIIEEECF